MLYFHAYSVQSFNRRTSLLSLLREGRGLRICKLFIRSHNWDATVKVRIITRSAVDLHLETFESSRMGITVKKDHVHIDQAHHIQSVSFGLTMPTNSKTQVHFIGQGSNKQSSLVEWIKTLLCYVPQLNHASWRDKLSNKCRQVDFVTFILLTRA